VPLTVTGISASGDFTQTNSCPSTLQTNGICSLTVRFTPSGVGTRTGAVTITGNTPEGTHLITLTGTGVAGGAQPVVSLSPTALAFGTVVVGGASGAQTVTLTNSGAAALTIAGMAASGDYTAAHACGAALAPGASCAVAVTFRPAGPGTRAGELTIASDAAGSPHRVIFTGVGLGSAGPVVSLSPSSVTFGAQAIGTTSGVLTAALRNTGASPLAISGVAVEGEFGLSHDCGASLAAGATCTISLTFTPQAIGTRIGRVIVTDDAPGSPHVLPVSGTGALQQMQFAPTALEFQQQGVGTTSAGQNITVSNAGGITITGVVITATGDFQQTNTCGTEIGGGAVCTITVSFAPTAAGGHTGTVKIASSAPGAPHQVVLLGRGN
jgi:hypothetical protein